MISDIHPADSPNHALLRRREADYEATWSREAALAHYERLDHIAARECPDCGGRLEDAESAALSHPTRGDYDIERLRCADCGTVYHDPA